MIGNPARRREILHHAFERMGVKPSNAYDPIEAPVTPFDAHQDIERRGERLDERINGEARRIGTFQAMATVFGALIAAR